MIEKSENDPARSIPSLWTLFTTFVIVSAFGFGGTLAWTRRMAVDERRWMSASEFNEVFSLCQFLPGPNVANFTAVIGARMRGVAGAICATAGLIAPALVLMILLGALYARYGDFEPLRRALAGISTSAAGLILGTAARMAQPLFQSGKWVAPAITIATLIVVGFLRVPLWWALAVLLPLAIALGWRQAQ